MLSTILLMSFPGAVLAAAGGEELDAHKYEVTERIESGSDIVVRAKFIEPVP